MKKGQRVKVVGNSVCHKYNIGDIVTALGHKGYLATNNEKFTNKYGCKQVMNPEDYECLSILERLKHFFSKYVRVQL